jgi:hypothetical protein
LPGARAGGLAVDVEGLARRAHARQVY